MNSRGETVYLLDHLVHFVGRPEQLVASTSELGLHTVNGGKHEMWGTYNSLCYFGLSYIEFIGIYDEPLFEKSALEPYTLHETYKNKNYQNGVVRLALRTNSIEKDAESLKSLGYDIYGPEEFSRTRPDGSVLSWKLLHFGKEGQALEFPFIIQWDGEDEARYNDLVESGAIKPHTLGNVKLKEIEFEVKDLSIATEWAIAFGLDVKERGTSKTLNIPNCLFTFKQSADSDKISQVVISGAAKEQDAVIEGTKYIFESEK